MCFIVPGENDANVSDCHQSYSYVWEGETESSDRDASPGLTVRACSSSVSRETVIACIVEACQDTPEVAHPGQDLKLHSECCFSGTLLPEWLSLLHCLLWPVGNSGPGWHFQWGVAPIVRANLWALNIFHHLWASSYVRRWSPGLFF